MLAVGVDLVAIARIERLLARYGDRFLHRLCTPEELAEPTARRAETAAARFAAKEAAAKALGFGMRFLATEGVSLHEIEVIHDARGRPYLRLSGKAAAQAHATGLREWSLSLSHEAGLAVAFVVALG